MDTILLIIAGPLFVISLIAHIYVKLRLNPKQGSDLDDYYCEFEDRHPGYAKYTKWSKITFTAVIISMTLLLIAALM
ncbi:MAG: hypothetical protein PHQ35_06020 [Phycisphaerae bacterium]|nr:hypothetical protein [Phycisphaerae bacterium]MDD5381265.1 hypothetical protein [Phycisphaerae bacterium]